MKIKILFLVLAASLVSCDSWFDIRPKTEVRADLLLNDQNGFRDGLLGVYSLMTTSTLYGANLTYGFADIAAQNYDNINNLKSHSFYFASNYNYTEPSEEKRHEAIWSQMYKCIVNLNAMLEVIDSKKQIFSEGYYEVIKGEALALRALLHFDLVRLYGPIPATGMSATAIPYMDRYTNQSQPPLSLTDFLTKTIKDLNEASELMRERDPYGPSYTNWDMTNLPAMLQYRNNRLNYYAVRALLSRVYLYAGLKPEALAVAQELIGAPGNETPVKPFVLATSAGSNDPLFASELIFSLNVVRQADQTNPYLGDDAEKGIIDSLLTINDANRNTLFEKGSGVSVTDYRMTVWFKETSSGNFKINKYNGQTTMPLLKLSEIYLIAAECATNVTDGVAYLNTLKNHRGLVSNTSIATEEQLKAAIRAEYMKEFYGEGQMLYYHKRNMSTTMGVANIPVKAPQVTYILPIPKAEIENGNIIKR